MEAHEMEYYLVQYTIDSLDEVVPTIAFPRGKGHEKGVLYLMNEISIVVNRACDHEVGYS
jgi:hypothetical protein